jgi:hypothetical protein
MVEGLETAQPQDTLHKQDWQAGTLTDRFKGYLKPLSAP